MEVFFIFQKFCPIHRIILRGKFSRITMSCRSDPRMKRIKEKIPLEIVILFITNVQVINSIKNRTQGPSHEFLMPFNLVSRPPNN